MTSTRPFAISCAAAAAASLVIGGAGSAYAATTTVYKVTEIETSSSDDIGNGPPAVGDSFAFTSKLKQRGVRVGGDKGTCKVTKINGPAKNPTGGTFRCRVIVTFSNKGTLTILGKTVVQFNDEPSVFTVPIVSGTGKFDGATGKVRVREVSDGVSKLTLTVTR